LERADELFVAHHNNKYGGQFPIWVSVEVLSFSTLSKLFSNLKNEDKRKIAKDYYGVPYVYISTWLRVLSVVRNICAHYGRLYGRRINTQPRLDSDDRALGFDASRVFAAIFLMKKLYVDEQAWNYFVINLQALVDQYDEVDCNLMGFCKEWYKVLTF
jgi:abortive infection bacteriophage resistance protein